MAGYAPELGQSADFAMEANATAPGLQRALVPANGSVANATDSGVNPGRLLQPRQRQLEIHVKLNNNMWWAMPHALSDGILEHWRSGAQENSYIWDWQNARRIISTKRRRDHHQSIHA